MKIIFIGHSHHLQTKSSDFFLKILNELGTVDCIWDESWKTKILPDISIQSIAEYNLVIVWQMDHFAELFAGKHPNVVFVPMYDSSMGQHEWFWKSLAGTKIISFSGAIHRRATQAGLQSLRVQYFPDPTLFCAERKWDSLRGFFWQRNAKITWAEVRMLIGEQPFSHFTLHGALDPIGNANHIMPDDNDRTKFHLTISSWFKDRQDFINTVNFANVNFAPRTDEGIGMAFLESMAMGQLVVAPNRPTMNEYIVHKLNGLLYDHQHPAPLDFNEAQQMATRARKFIEEGHQEWLLSIPHIHSFLRHGSIAPTPPQPIHTIMPASMKMVHPGQKFKSKATQGGLRTQGLVKQDCTQKPLITIATVVYNGEKCIEKTMRSVLEQDYENIEYIVIDGASSDNTVNILRSCDSIIDLWLSEKDCGPYDAMNKAASLANGRWIIFMNAGDTFHSPRAVQRAIKNAPADADFIIGHHIYVSTDGTEHDTMTADFMETWKTLIAGTLTDSWKQGIPCHQATFTRTKLIQEHCYDINYKITADHDFMYRMRKRDATFYHCNAHIAYYHGGGISAQNKIQCIIEWRNVALKFTHNANKVRQFYNVHLKNALLDNVSRNDWKSAFSLGLKKPPLLIAALKRAGGSRSTFKIITGLFSKKYREIDFRLPLTNSPIMNISGLSSAEEWGAWTCATEIAIRLKSPLAGRVKISMRLAHIFHTCINSTITMEFGGIIRQIPLTSTRTISVDFGPGISGDTLYIRIPRAASPAQTGHGDDTRKLGIGIESLSFENSPR